MSEPKADPSAPGPEAAPARRRKRTRYAVRAHPLAFALGGIGSAFLILSVIVGTPVNTPAALFIVLVVIGVGVHASLGALVGGVVGETGPHHLAGRVVDRARDVAVVVILVVALLAAGFWYAVVTYSDMWPWLVGVAVVAFGAAFADSFLACRPGSTRTAMSTRIRRLVSDQFTPVATFAGMLLGLVVALVLFYASVAVDTGASHTAPEVVALPSTGAYASFHDYVALGDSYSAGEGLDPSGDCHRSTQAYGRILAAKEGWNVDLQACSGAVIGDIFGTVFHGPQVTGPPDPKVGLVTMTIGGNNALFSTVVIACVEHPSCMWGIFPPKGDSEPDSLIATPPPGPLDHDWGPGTILSIAEQLGKPDGTFALLRDHFPNARIVVTGYPYLFPTGAAPLSVDLLCDTILRRVDQPVRAELHYIQDRFNDAIFEAAVRQGVEFISPNLLWAGHEPCGPHGQWTNSIESALGMGKLLGTGPFHPNSAGQHALAALVSCYLKDLPPQPSPQQFDAPSGWLTPPSALKLADGSPFPREWGTQASDFAGCSFPRVTSSPAG
jgi:hypothetical protein